MRQLQSVQHLAAMATPPPSSTGVHTDTFLILAAVLCFLLCVVGLALVARCSRLCNPSAFSVDTAPVVAPAPAPSKGLKKKALQSLPIVPFEEGEGEERPECAICLAEFARGDEIRVLPSCGHGFHSVCVDVWLLSHSTCPSCRRALIIAPPAGESPPVAPWRAVCSAAVSVAVHALAETEAGAGERARCRTSVP